MSSFREAIITENDEQVSFEILDTIDTPIEERGPRLVVTFNDYRPYPMCENVRWVHKGEERGFYKINKLVWENGVTRVYIKEVL